MRKDYNMLYKKMSALYLLIPTHWQHGQFVFSRSNFELLVLVLMWFDLLSNL